VPKRNSKNSLKESVLIRFQNTAIQSRKMLMKTLKRMEVFSFVRPVTGQVDFIIERIKVTAYWKLHSI
jgi:hypothetical protein